ncbi:COQ9 family protein [Pseudoruegeria sp. SK021]|uniref:COQ9 family protein n=1 Tax=Pseudoruegeria sp. SK021 TaxID=1933035 RepID=UPI000A249B5C|nr:COQ9 family protein [Pseudoruegeria sp. SK021]OSP56762.1 ubiquinone biosynthesis protein [Pseudoruegeria sp. SK021]
MADQKSLPPSDAAEALLQAIVPHVPFDGWTEAAFQAALADSGVNPVVARGVCPRGALDLAVLAHRRGDDAMVARLEAEDLSARKFRDRIALAVRYRLEAAGDQDVVRRASALFALPNHAPEGAKLVWDTAGRIWTALGDTSDDVNWYTKRATLSGVYASTLLYWLGDDSDGQARTWDFLDRRIADVMQIEKLKAQVRDSKVLKPFLAGPSWALSKIKAPARTTRNDMPGRWRTSQ